MSTTPKPSLFSKLAEVMAEVGRVPKSGRNEFHKYDYVTEADLVEAVREKLAERQVMLIPSVVDVGERPSGGKDTITTVRVRFTFIDGESGEQFQAEWAGSGADQGDKGIYKAYTGALKYFLMKAFLIATGDDPEGDHGTDKRAAQAANGHGVTAEAPKPTERVATAKQRGMLNGKAAEAGLSKADLADLMLKATGKPEREWDDPAAAESFVDRAFPRFPASAVDKLVELIGAEREQVPF